MRTFLRFCVAPLALVLGGSACSRTRPLQAPTAAAGPRISITSASVNATNQVVVQYTVRQNDVPVGAADAARLGPAWTLAVLATDPESGLPAWVSQVLTGSEVLAKLPIDGPGTSAPNVLENARQPGAEGGGTVQDLGAGTLAYTFQAALPQGFDASRTMRVGVWLAGAPGTADTTSTLDFVPNGGSPTSRELVLDAACSTCHGVLRAHGGSRTGVRICATCHTYQNADADTRDPAAMSGATAATNPNPLDLGRLVHRIHRGKNLPTLYVAAPLTTNPAAPDRANLALPFSPARNVPLPGQKYSVVGFQAHETVYGEVKNRTDNNQPPKAVASGVAFPQDLRNCEACHGGAAQSDERFTDISRRTCGSCHADTWFGDVAAITDSVHYMHPGGPQPDDTQCASCHIPSATNPAVDADITAIHVAPVKSPSYDGLTANIVDVQNLEPGQTPTVVFTLTDRNGTPSPLNTPTPAMDATSPVPRALGRVAITISGPTSPDYVTGNFAAASTAPVTEAVPLAAAADASGRFSYTFASALPAGATGTWAVSLEARRSSATPFFDVGSDAYSWPFTGETLNEYADNPVAYVDVALGALAAGRPVPRRTVIQRDACNGCHMDLSAHGGLRHNPEYCVMCHAPDATDWSRRPKDAGNNTSLGTTYDGIEERSIHFDVLVHRIHTGAHSGTAELDRSRPFIVYGFDGPSFFDDVRYPNDLANCTVCHTGNSYAPEAAPAGALPTVANETAAVQHGGSAAHVSSEPTTAPITAACLSCHDTATAQVHASEMATGGDERCRDCHASGASVLSVQTVHGISLPR